MALWFIAVSTYLYFLESPSYFQNCNWFAVRSSADVYSLLLDTVLISNILYRILDYLFECNS